MLEFQGKALKMNNKNRNRQALLVLIARRLRESHERTPKTENRKRLYEKEGKLK